MQWLNTFLDAVQQNLLTVIAVFVVTLLVLALKSRSGSSEAPIDLLNMAQHCGNITLEELAKYDGVSPFRPTYLAVKGQIYDVSSARDFYGKGGSYHVFAGKECARALAKMAIDAEHCTGEVGDLRPREQEILQDWITKFEEKYTVVGQVVEPKTLTLEQLAEYSGSSSDKPIYLAIKGVIFDVSKGKDFYGPDGVYPFAGRECARAFALLSTDTADCHANLDGLDKMELENLSSWQAKFYDKYSIVGRII